GKSFSCPDPLFSPESLGVFGVDDPVLDVLSFLVVKNVKSWACTSVVYLVVPSSRCHWRFFRRPSTSILFPSHWYFSFISAALLCATMLRHSVFVTFSPVCLLV